MSLGHSAYNLRDMSFELCIFVQGFLGYKEKRDEKSLESLLVYDNFESSYINEIQIKIVSCAILYRRLEDEAKKTENENYVSTNIPQLPFSCNKFAYNYGVAKPITNLREASNKIIHSEEFWLYDHLEYIDKKLVADGYFDKDKLNSIVFLSGEKFKKEWLVAIDLLAFSENLYKAADNFAEYYGI